MIYLLIVAAAIALILLYKFMATRKNFFVICAVIVVVFGISAFMHNQQAQREEISRAQLEELHERQKIFGDWYAAYQRDIDSLDRNWQTYHNIVDGLQAMDADSFNAEAVYLRLRELEQESIDEQIKIYGLTAPQLLDEESRTLVENVIRKTKDYVDAQTRTISLSVKVAQSVTELEPLKLKLHDVMIRESPEGLFTAQEISAIRDKLGD
ncbi:MAG: hypothetical protein IJ685_14260 [Selenomonadaceae bacterium]|nr:hypothetical protein [Selenomonadaceae bacterium]